MFADPVFQLIFGQAQISGNMATIFTRCLGDVALVNDVFTKADIRVFTFLRDAAVTGTTVTFVGYGVFGPYFFIVGVESGLYVVARGV